MFQCSFQAKPFGNDFGKIKKQRASACLDSYETLKNYTEYVNPHWMENETCTLALMTNLAQAEWISVPCDQKLLDIAACVKDTGKYSRKSTDEKEPDNWVCQKNTIVRDRLCHMFIWTNQNANFVQKLISSCGPQSFKQAIFQDNMYFEFIYEATRVKPPPLLLPVQDEENTLRLIKHNKYLTLHRFYHEIVTTSAGKGFFVCLKNQTKMEAGSNIFKCTNGGYISCLLICDGHFDCANDSSDEEPCAQANFTDAINISSKITSDFFMNINGAFRKYYLQEDRKGSQQIMFTLCSGGSQIETTMQDDLVVDCFPDGEDEPLLLSLLKGNHTYHCSNPNEIPCVQGHSKCYPVGDICTYKVNSHGHTLPCRTGDHLQECRTFACNSMFKCALSYCIPWSYVCNARWDCPAGDDETFSNRCKGNTTCGNMFKCRNTKHKCLGLGNVCDEHIDCPHGDDERLCELKGIKCFSNCTCLALAIRCAQVEFGSTQVSFPYISIVITHSHFMSHSILQMNWRNALIFEVLHSNLKFICRAPLPQSLLLLKVEFNLLTLVDNKCFLALTLLHSLLLPNNRIERIKSSSFVNLNSLVFLSLSNNPLASLSTGAFSQLPHLNVLLINSSIFKFELDTFKNLKVDMLETIDYYICCVVSAQICTASKPWYIACMDILPNDQFWKLFVSVSCLVLVFNSLSILTHIPKCRQKDVFSLIVISLNGSDLLCCTYLCLIWIAHFIWKGSLAVEHEQWMSSPTCFTAFGTMLWYSVLNQTIMFIMALSRMMVVLKPLNSKFKDSQYVLTIILCIVASTFAASTLLSVLTFLLHRTLPFSLCPPYVDLTGSVSVMKVLTWVVMVTQSATCVAIGIMHGILLLSLHHSKAVGGKSKITLPLVSQLFILTVCTALCWFSTNTTFGSALLVSPFSVDVLVWITGAVLPLNSLTNPLVFSLLSVRNYFYRSKEKQTLPNQLKEIRVE